MCRKIVSQRLSKRDCIFPLARADIFGVRLINQSLTALRVRWDLQYRNRRTVTSITRAKSTRNGKVATTVAQEWQRGGRRSTHQKAGVCVVFVVLVFFNFICTSPIQMTVKCLRCGERGAACMAHEAAIPRVSLHHTLGYPMTRTMIRFIIDNEAAIKAITSHRTLPVLKTFFLDRKNTLLKYYSYIFDRHRTLSPVWCRSLEILWQHQKKLPHRETFFVQKTTPPHVHRE